MQMTLIQFGASALVIVVCGIALTRFADAMAGRTRLGRIWVGSIFLKSTASASTSQLSLTQAVLGYAITAGVILVAGPLLAASAGKLAEQTGLGETFVGTTLVAVSTSLPELVTTLTALRMGAFDLALANIFGSNAFNVVILVVVDLAYSKPLLAVASSTHLITCLSTILITGVAVLGQLYRVESRRRFLEPDAWLVIGLALGALGVIYLLRDGPF